MPAEAARATSRSNAAQCTTQQDQQVHKRRGTVHKPWNDAQAAHQPDLSQGSYNQSPEWICRCLVTAGLYMPTALLGQEQWWIRQSTSAAQYSATFLPATIVNTIVFNAFTNAFSAWTLSIVGWSNAAKSLDVVDAQSLLELARICMATGVEDSRACDAGPAGASNCASGRQLTICTCPRQVHIQILYEHNAGGGRRQRLPQQLARSNTLCNVCTAWQFEMRIHTRVCFANAAHYHRQNAAGEHSGAAVNWFRHRGTRHSRYPM